VRHESTSKWEDELTGTSGVAFKPEGSQGLPRQTCGATLRKEERVQIAIKSLLTGLLLATSMIPMAEAAELSVVLQFLTLVVELLALVIAGVGLGVALAALWAQRLDK
jgi:hypothetical protein